MTKVYLVYAYVHDRENVGVYSSNELARKGAEKDAEERGRLIFWNDQNEGCHYPESPESRGATAYTITEFELDTNTPNRYALKGQVK